MSPCRQRGLVLMLLAGCHAAPSSDTTTAPQPESKVTQDRPALIVEVVAGPESTCARDARGRVACLGHGVAYDEEVPDRDTHVPQVAPIPPSKGISAGEGFACSVDREGGKVRCWGANGAGQLGRKTRQYVDQRPAEVPGLEGVERIVSHGPRTCAVTDGQLWCWPGHEDPSPRAIPLEGRSIERALYDHLRSGKALGFSFSAEPRVEHPWREGLSVRCPFVDSGAPEFLDDDLYAPEYGYACGGATTIEVGPGVEVGKDHACRLDQGAVRCEGADTVGQAPATPPNFGAPVLDIAVGSEHTCALIAEGELRCWGSSTRGQLGLPPVHSRAPVLAQTDVAKVWLTETRTCVQTHDGAFLCTGESRDPCDTPAFTPLRGPTQIREVFDVLSGGCLVAGDGALWCEVDQTWTPVIAADAFPGPSTSRSQYGASSAGWLCWLADALPTCARWEEPYAQYPELREDPLHTETPFGTSRAASLRWYGDLLCALDRGGTVHCKAPPAPARDMRWTDAEVPGGKVERLTDSGWLFEDRTLLRIWGTDDRNREAPSLRSLPAELPQGTRVAVASNGCIVTEDGQLSCEDEAPLPDRPFETVASAPHHTCALDTEHGLWCWGDATGGRLGGGDAVCSRTPRSLSEDFYDAWKAAP